MPIQTGYAKVQGHAPPQPKPEVWRPSKLLTAALLAASVALRIPGLLESLWFDEVYRTLIGLRPDNIRELLLHDVHNPLYNALMYIWVRVFGDSEVSIRMPSMLAGYAMAWLVWHWARDRFGERAAFFTAAWLLLAPVPVWYFTEAKNSIFTALFAAMIVITHDRLLTSASRRAAWWAGAAAVLGVLTDFQVLLTLIPVWAFVIWKSRRSDARLLALTPIAGGTTALLPLLLFKVAHAADLPREYLGLFNLKALLWFLCIWFPTGTVLPNPPAGWWPVAVAAPGVIVLPLLWLGLRRLRQTTSGALVVACFATPLIFYLIASAALHAAGDHHRIYQDRNIIVLLPWFGLILAMGIQSLPRWRAAAATLILTATTACTILTLTLLKDSWTVMSPNPDWRGAARLMGQHPLVFSKTSLFPLQYYSPTSDRVEAMKGTVIQDVIAARISNQSTPFFVISDPFWTPLTDNERAALDQHFPLQWRRHLQSLDLECRTPTAPAPHP